MNITTNKEAHCPSCGSGKITNFFSLKGIPVHSVLLMPTREFALNYPKGEIELGFCSTCEFIYNTAFNPEVHEYSSRYEETQGFSPTFNVFAEDLAARLIERYDLHSKDITEIGCGKGEFLSLICKLGQNRGVGFDPSYIESRNRDEATGQIKFINNFYSEKYAGFIGDFIICKMTLEHIQNVANFVSMIRRSIGNRQHTVVFFQVPDVTRVLSDCAFEDIYYEHCSYFSPKSLVSLFNKCGFNVQNQETGYNGQYLMIEAEPAFGETLQENAPKTLLHEITNFKEKYQGKINAWQLKLEEYRQAGKRVVIWGGGSKAVAFLSGNNMQHEVKYVVDINPYKHGTFMPGTGQEIISPVFLGEYRPDTVIVMNPIYRKEIEQELKNMSLKPEILTV